MGSCIRLPWCVPNSVIERKPTWPLCEHAGSYELPRDPVAVIFPLRRDANQPQSNLSKKPIHKSIAGAAFRPSMGGVIKFDGRDDSRGVGATDDEVDVLLADAIGMTAFPGGVFKCD